MEEWSALHFRLTLLVSLLFLAACTMPHPLRGTIAFHGSTGRDDWGIYLFDLPEYTFTRLTPESVRANFPEWSPDGMRLAFRCEMPEGVTGICLIDRDGSNLSTLVTEGETGFKMSIVRGPLAWSPDGRDLVFDGSAADGSGSRLYTVDVSTGQIQPLTPSVPRLFYARAISWSPDGGRLAIQTTSSEIYLMDAENLEMEYLTDGFAPVWSPDGGQLAFSGPYSLLTIAPDGTGLRILLEEDGICPGSRKLTWSPDGQYIAFMSICEESDPLEIYVFDMQSGRAHRLLRGKMDGLIIENLAWAPDL